MGQPGGVAGPRVRPAVRCRAPAPAARPARCAGPSSPSTFPGP